MTKQTEYIISWCSIITLKIFHWGVISLLFWPAWKEKGFLSFLSWCGIVFVLVLGNFIISLTCEWMAETKIAIRDIEAQHIKKVKQIERRRKQKEKKEQKRKDNEERISKQIQENYELVKQIKTRLKEIMLPLTKKDLLMDTCVWMNDNATLFFDTLMEVFCDMGKKVTILYCQIEELDNNKDKHGDKGYRARLGAKRIETLQKKGLINIIPDNVTYADPEFIKYLKKTPSPTYFLCNDRICRIKVRAQTANCSLVEVISIEDIFNDELLKNYFSELHNHNHIPKEIKQIATCYNKQNRRFYF